MADLYGSCGDRGGGVGVRTVTEVLEMSTEGQRIQQQEESRGRKIVEVWRRSCGGASLSDIPHIKSRG